MTLPASGTIGASDINVELGRASTAAFSMDGADERALAGVPSGAIAFTDFHGKSAASEYTLTKGHFSPVGGLHFYGLIEGSAGSIAPTTYLGNTIFDMHTNNNFGDPNSVIEIDGTHPKDYFTTWEWEVGVGSLASSASTHTQSGGRTQWFWAGADVYTGTGVISVKLS